MWSEIITGVLGLAGGASVTAWAKWPIEKRRLTRQRRYELLDTWRSGIASPDSGNHSDALGTPWYETLRS
jgi:hypothetical protein